MKLQALQLAVQYATAIPAYSQNNAKIVLDIARDFELFLNEVPDNSVKTESAKQTPSEPDKVGQPRKRSK